MNSNIMETLEDKFNKKIETLYKRNEERLVDIEKDKRDKKQLNAENEKLDYFEKIFLDKYRDIEMAIKKSNEIAVVDDLANHFNSISQKILQLQKHVANSNIFLRGYDIKVFQRSLSELTTLAKEYEDKLLPKKKFGFKRKNKTKSDGLLDNVDGQLKTEVEHIKDISEIFANKNACNVENKTNASISVIRDDMSGKDVTLNNLVDCNVKLFGTPSTLHINSLNDCRVFCGPVSTSIFIENCKNCTFVIACQQLRLHKSNDINIYLHVTSRAIMEDCHNVNFAPYNLYYDNVIHDFHKSGLDKNVNNWNCIDDFNWLNAEKPSPNWKIIAKDNIITNWNDLHD